MSVNLREGTPPRPSVTGSTSCSPANPRRHGRGPARRPIRRADPRHGRGQGPPRGRRCAATALPGDRRRVEPAALVDAINQAQAGRTAAAAYIDSAPLDDTLDVAEVYAMLDADNELVDGLSDSPAARLARLYRHLDLSLRYLPDERAVFMRARPRVDSGGVRGWTRTPVRRTLRQAGVHVTTIAPVPYRDVSPLGPTRRSAVQVRRRASTRPWRSAALQG